jgi:hypothetical protein
MIEVVTEGNAGLMAGLLERMGAGGAARVHLYGGARPAANAAASGTLVAVVYMAEPAGTINTATGALELAPGIEAAVLAGVTPTWARVSNGNESHLFDCDARLSIGVNLGQELVVAAPNGFYAGALLQIQSGTFTALP